MMWRWVGQDEPMLSGPPHKYASVPDPITLEKYAQAGAGTDLELGGMPIRRVLAGSEADQ